MIIGFIIWSMCALIFLAIGISGWKSEKAVGFFTFVNPPEMKDIKKYNHAVSVLWFIFTILFEIMGIPVLFIKQNSPVAILLVFGVFFLVIGIIIAYLKIETKYRQ